MQRGLAGAERSAREQQSGRARLTQHGRQLPRQVRVLVVRAEHHDQEQQRGHARPRRQVQHGHGRPRRPRRRAASACRQSHPIAIHSQPHALLCRRLDAQLQSECELLQLRLSS